MLIVLYVLLLVFAVAIAALACDNLKLRERLAIASADNTSLRARLAMHELLAQGGTDTLPGFDVNELLEETLPGADELRVRKSTLRPPAIPRELRPLKATLRAGLPKDDGPKGAA